VRSSNILTFVTNPILAISVFRLNPLATTNHPEEHSLDSLNTLNKIFYTRISARREISLTQTVLNGVFCIRLVVGGMKTTKEHISQAYRLLMEEGKLAIAEWGIADDVRCVVPFISGKDGIQVTI
jgi:aromatic-L-amino-acid decarboxylase